jgi:predicted CopG family antitoxin
MVIIMKTTIMVETDVRDKLKEFGMKGETYSDIITRLYESAARRQMTDIMMDDRGYVPIEEALEKAKKRYGK